MKTVNILGVNITAEPLTKVLAAIQDSLEGKREGGYVCATSVHGVIESQSDPGLLEILNHAFINLPDGLPLAKVGCWLGATQIEQIKGITLFPLVCEMTAQMNVKHFFYGGQHGVAEKLAQVQRKKFPNLKVAGTYCPPFRFLTSKEKEQIILMINESGADIIWIGLSTPKQEKWIGEFHTKLHAKLIFSVGAVFDFYTGRISFAPPWVHRLGLEWLYRLISEPGRLWKRYLKIVPMFIIFVTLQIFKSKVLRW